MTIRGSGLTGAVSTLVTFTGPAGVDSLEPSIAAPDGSFLIVFVPIPVAITAGDYAITVAANDGASVRHSGPATFRVIDPEAGGRPLISVPEFVEAEAQGPGGALVTFSVSAIDSVTEQSLDVTCSRQSGSLFPLGKSLVSCSASNANGTANDSFVILVTDTVEPVISVPEDIVSGSAVVEYSVSANDAVDGAVNVTCRPSSGSKFRTGLTRVLCVASDSHHNRAVATFNVTVTDGVPALNLPADFEFEATGALTPVPYTATAEGGAISCTPPSGSSLPLGVTTVTCSSTNSFGTATESFRITVVDTTPPALNLPDIDAEATSAAGAEVSWQTTAHDLVDGDRPVSCRLITNFEDEEDEGTPVSSPRQFAIGVHVLECHATDVTGNGVGDIFRITVADTTAPSVTATPSVATLWPPNHKMIDVTINVVAFDAVDPAPVSQMVSVASNQPINGTGDGDQAPDWVITGPFSLQLRAERSGNNDRTYTITIRTTDLYGNITITPVEVKVTQSNSRP